MLNLIIEEKDIVITNKSENFKDSSFKDMDFKLHFKPFYSKDSLFITTLETDIKAGRKKLSSEYNAMLEYIFVEKLYKWSGIHFKDKVLQCNIKNKELISRLNTEFFVAASEEYKSTVEKRKSELEEKDTLKKK